MAATDFVTEAQIDSLVTNIATAVKANTTAHTNHLNDTTDAHDASAISVLDAGTLYTATDVEAALAEVMTDTNTAQSTADNHISDATGAHAASAISVADSGLLYTATEVEAALAEVMTQANAGVSDAATAQSTADNHISDTSAAHAASAISILDTNNKYTATDVEAALEEVRIVADSAAGGGVAINDSVTNTTDAWSSSKISTEISTAVSGIVDAAPAALDTLNELAAALGDDANFATTTSTALGNRLRFDAAQTLDGTQKSQAWSNLQIAASAVDFATAFNTAIA